MKIKIVKDLKQISDEFWEILAKQSVIVISSSECTVIVDQSAEPLKIS